MANYFRLITSVFLILVIGEINSVAHRVFKYLTEYDPNDPTVLITDYLPLDSSNKTIDFRLMPYVGNGHLAATVFNNELYVNGLYNGERGESHRARLPNIHRFRLLRDLFLYKQYILDMKHGNNKSHESLSMCINLINDFRYIFRLIYKLKGCLWNNSGMMLW